jgi:hypothetical protein
VSNLDAWGKKTCRDSLFLRDFFGFRRTAHGPQTRLQVQTFGRLSLPRLRSERHAAVHAPTQCGQLCLGFRLIHPLLPSLWFRDRARLQRRAWQSKRRSAQAAPTPSTRTSRQPGAQRVALHLAQHAQAILILGHRERLEAALDNGVAVRLGASWGCSLQSARAMIVRYSGRTRADGSWVIGIVQPRISSVLVQNSMPLLPLPCRGQGRPR